MEMQTLDKLFAQNWIEQFREDYYGPAGNMSCPIMGVDEVLEDAGLDIVIMDCLHWASCGTRRITWKSRYRYHHGFTALPR